MRRFAGLMSLGLCWEFAPTPALAEFVPGRIHLADSAIENCQLPFPNDRDLIWEVDPLTGSSRVFAEVTHPLCGAMYGLTFTPDSSRLRASMFMANAILEIDGDGNVAAGLDAADGLTNPAGSNNIAYDPAGNFYAVVSRYRILRFPVEGGPPQVFADGQDGVNDWGAIDTAPNGDIFYLRPGDAGRVTRFSPEGVPTAFPDTIRTWDLGTLTVDDLGDLYVWGREGVFRYRGGNPGNRELIALSPPEPLIHTSITYSPIDGYLYLAGVGNLWSLDRDSGELRQIGDVGMPDRLGIVGIGSAVHVPEPASVLTLVAAAAVFARSRRSRSDVG